MSTRTITPTAAAGYSIGDFALNLFWGGAGYFLLYWYTDVIGLPAAVAGTLFLVGSLWDAVADLSAGLAADRTRTRFGQYRPFLLLGAVPLALTFALLFYAPTFPSR